MRDSERDAFRNPGLVERLRKAEGERDAYHDHLKVAMARAERHGQELDAERASSQAREKELKARLLSDEILTAFDQDFCERVFAEDDMPALLDYRRAMTAAIVRAFDD